MRDREIKVTDKRMFTPTGELREEYRERAEKSTAPPPAERQPPPPPPPAPPPMPPVEPAPGRPALELPGTPPELGGPSFFDLAAVLAEPVALYLGDLEIEGGLAAENLEMARMHLDLLDILRRKTAGNLDAQEAAFLEDLLYRLRVRYVQKRG